MEIANNRPIGYWAPDTLTGKEFEDKIGKSNVIYLREGVASVGHYGVHGVWRFVDGARSFQPIASKPDFEGLVAGGQIIFDAKVCSAASFDLSRYREGEKKRRQLAHMYERSRFGADCFLLIHWNLRETTKKRYLPETFRFPVSRTRIVSTIGFWRKFEAGALKRITREDCYEYGTPVFWGLGKGVAKPDYLNWKGKP